MGDASWLDRRAIFHVPKLRHALSSDQIRGRTGTTTDQEVPCRGCGAPLAARDDEFVLNIFFTDSDSQKAVAKATS